LYLVAYLDRANVSFAALKMNLDLGFGDRVYGLGVAMFFLGYVLFEVPGAIIVERWSARKWTARIMISWGLVTILSGLVHSPRQFYAARFFLGMAEASFFPGMIVYLTHWIRLSERGRAVTILYAAIPSSAIIRSEEHTSELQSPDHLVCRLLLEKKKINIYIYVCIII